tara:strand:+ start:106 stop:333 length:228 start_codon:yes stop_codon:yes gene_type:complete
MNWFKDDQSEKLQVLSDQELQQYRANANKTFSNALGHTKAHWNEKMLNIFNGELERRKLSVDDTIQGVFNGKGSW